MDVLGIGLAGGGGRRLLPLTLDRSKPAVPMAGKYRLIDFVLSNLVNSGIESVYVLTQYKAQSLIRHIELGWRVEDLRGDRFLTTVPAQMRGAGNWYLGSADAVRQNLNLIERHRPRLVAIFGADHVYRMDVRQMVAEHDRTGARVTVAALPVSTPEARQFGVIEVDGSWRIVGFQEKPADPRAIPGEPETALVSMGNYVFDTSTLVRALEEHLGHHDFGGDVLPSLVGSHPVHAYDFRKNRLPLDFAGEEPGYWRDVGTIDAYYASNMDLRTISPSLNLYNRRWPIRTVGSTGPPAKFVFDEQGRSGVAINSIVAGGSIISGSRIYGSVIGRNVRIHSFCQIEDSVIMDWVEIGRHCRIKGAIIDKFNTIEAGTSIGFSEEADRARYTVSEGGIVVIGRAPEKEAWTTVPRAGSV